MHDFGTVKVRHFPPAVLCVCLIFSGNRRDSFMSFLMNARLKVQTLAVSVSYSHH